MRKFLLAFTICLVFLESEDPLVVGLVYACLKIISHLLEWARE